jgi:phage baseplate assembly protein W
MATTTYYSDIPTNFDVHPVKEDLVLVTNESAVKRSIRNLLLTDPYERFFNPLLGSGIRQTLFENVSKDTEFFLKEKITETIVNYEPRADLISVGVKALPDENAYSASIIFAISNSTQPVTLDLVLRRVR